MTLEECRKMIDTVDPQIRDFLMKRLDCSYQVAQAKQESGDLTIYRADREAAILERLGADVPEERKAGYLAVVRKIMETSRMYQYGLLYDWNEGIFDTIEGSELADHPGRRLKVRLTRPDQPNAMSSILSMVGDYGYNMELMELIGTDAETGGVTFDLTILGDISEVHMRKLIFQLSRESSSFRIIANRE